MRLLRIAIAMALTLAAASVHAAEMRKLSMPLPGGGILRYGLFVPDGYRANQPRPLVLALHPGGERMLYYGSEYADWVVVPAAADLGAIIVAPDCPTNAWTDAAADAAVMALLEFVMRDYNIDRRRVLVTGFSMGGRGAWFMSSHHRDLFTGAIPMAASVGNDPQDTLATMPTYVIHSRRDEVVPFAPAEQNAKSLARLGRPVLFEALGQPPHFDMGAYIPALGRAIDWISGQWRRTKSSEPSKPSKPSKL